MAQCARQWTYFSIFMGEGSKPEQLYSFISLLWSVVVRRRPSCVVRRASTFDVNIIETTFVIRFL